jgi:ketosteroid isomerase-like protein
MKVNLWIKTTVVAFLILSFISNHTYPQKPGMIDKEKIRNEIKQVEKRFQDDLKKYGVESAFYKYAAEKAVIKRENDSLIKGNEAIKNYYSNPIYTNAVAVWEPDFVDVSEDGTMAYTYGKYEWNFIDKTGKKSVHKGVFHTVWKRMPNNSWKYVWD